MPKPDVDADRLPSIKGFNTKKDVRPELAAAKPDDMPSTLNSMVRLRGGKVVSLEPRQTNTEDSKWKFPGNVERLLTHRFQYILELEGPVSLVFTRGKNSVREWVELADDEGVVTLVLTNEDVKGHDNIIEDKNKEITTLVEWKLLHRCFVEPDEVKPTTKFEKKFPLLGRVRSPATRLAAPIRCVLADKSRSRSSCRDLVGLHRRLSWRQGREGLAKLCEVRRELFKKFGGYPANLTHVVVAYVKRRWVSFVLFGEGARPDCWHDLFDPAWITVPPAEPLSSLYGGKAALGMCVEGHFGDKGSLGWNVMYEGEDALITSRHVMVHDFTSTTPPRLASVASSPVGSAKVVWSPIMEPATRATFDIAICKYKNGEGERRSNCGGLDDYPSAMAMDLDPQEDTFGLPESSYAATRSFSPWRTR